MEKIKFSKLPQDIKAEYNKKMIGVLSFFCNFCEEHKLRYSLAYGSVLGAVRHKGIIPWDYDIDTYMPRPDYEKFVMLFKKERPNNYQLLTPQDTPFYPEPLAKLGDKNTSLLFTKFFPVDYGIFIDIFPIDGAAENANERKKDFKKFNNYIRLFRVFQSSRRVREMLKLFLHGGYKHVFLSLFSIPFNKFLKKYCIEKMVEISYSHPYENSKYVIQYRDDSYGLEKSWIPREWIEKTIIVPFETINVRIPQQYDAYLKHYYGDYMQLPPENKRDDRHVIDYLNINMRESMESILEKLKD